MSGNAPVLIGLGIAGIGIAWAVSRKAKAEEPPSPPPGGNGVGCYTLSPAIRYYFEYHGDPKTFIEALGECGNPEVIYTIDVYDPDTDDWIPPADWRNDILYPGSLCAVKVQSKCILCGFKPI